MQVRERTVLILIMAGLRGLVGVYMSWAMLGNLSKTGLITDCARWP